jgi:hypothetical protein
MRNAVGVARPWRFGVLLRDQARDLGTAFETRIDQTLRNEPFDSVAIVGEMVGLAARRGFPGDAEPGEVLINRVLELELAAGRVDILDAQRNRPPVRSAKSKFSNAEKAWPRCR